MPIPIIGDSRASPTLKLVGLTVQGSNPKFKASPKRTFNVKYLKE